jgi:hypothetical protein
MFQLFDQRLGGGGAVISLSRGTALGTGSVWRAFIFMAKAPFELGTPILLPSYYAINDQKAEPAGSAKCS